MLLVLAAEYSNDLIQDVLKVQMSASFTIYLQTQNDTCHLLRVRRLESRLIYESSRIVDK
jgi:hypothetical protein